MPKGIPFRQSRKIWRWEFVTGFALLHGYRVGAEIGVSTGRFTTFLCSRIPDLRMIAVDLWEPQPGNEMDPGGQSYESWPHDDHYKTLVAHLDKEFPARVTVIRECSWDAARHVADGTLDFVFIDADHRYESVRKDIEAWLPKVRMGGMIAGHDYEERNWPGVVRAVDELVPGAMVADDAVWFAFIK